MAYEIKKTGNYKDTLKLTNEQGEELIIAVSINIEGMAAKYQNAQIKIAQIKKKIDDDDAGYEELGEATLELFELFFGEDNTKSLIKWYEGEYGELVIDVMPYINEVIVPKIKELSTAKRAKLQSARKKYRK